MRKAASSFATILASGDGRSIGRSNEVVRIVRKQTKRFSELVACLWNDDPIVRMRAADAAEKVSAGQPDLLAPFKGELLGLLLETRQQEVRWHLAQMIPRLSLNSAERRRGTAALHSFLSDGSSIVKTCAMQALAELAGQDARRRFEVEELIGQLVRTGTPAMKARGRKLLKQLQARPRTAVCPKPLGNFP